MNQEVAIVTGATQGIGLTIARTLVDAGYYVYGTYVSNYSAQEIQQIQCEGFSLHRVDGCDFEAVQLFVKEIGGSIAVLVNNAGIIRDSLLLRMTEEDFDDVMNTNLKGTFNMVKACSKGMLRNRAGAIINITSVIGEIGNSGQANYAASKAGIIGFSKSIAREFGGRNIRVNCVAPGFIETQMTQGLDDDKRSEIMNQTILKRLGQSSDVAEAVLFLCKAQYITGQVLNVCGGLVVC